jgi:bacterioferritin (cytochrome b1)
VSEPTKEYLFAKAALCSDIARQQLEKQEIAEALRNMERANRAMARIFNLDESEGENE